jgi:RNA polymerase sigma-70 factor (ECF subfamily)
VSTAALKDDAQPVNPDPENVLFQQFAAGDTQAFDVLFRRYSKPVFRLCVQIVGVPGRAEELAQEVFIKAHQAAPRWRPSGSFRGWLFRIARNHCLNALRGRKNRLRLLSVDAAETVGAMPTRRPEQLESLQSKTLQNDIAQALASMPENQRTALVLLRFEGLSYVEIAAAMQTTIPAVKGLLNRAKRHLTTALAHHLNAQDTP